MSKMETAQLLCMSYYSAWFPSQQNSVLLYSAENSYVFIFAHSLLSHHWHWWKETASIFVPSHQVFIQAKFPTSLLRLKGSPPMTCFWPSLLQGSIMGSASCPLGPRNKASTQATFPVPLRHWDGGSRESQEKLIPEEGRGEVKVFYSSLPYSNLIGNKLN